MEKELEEYYLKRLKELDSNIRFIKRNRNFKNKKEIDLFFSLLKTMSDKGNKALDEG